VISKIDLNNYYIKETDFMYRFQNHRCCFVQPSNVVIPPKVTARPADEANTPNDIVFPIKHQLF